VDIIRTVYFIHGPISWWN